ERTRDCGFDGRSDGAIVDRGFAGENARRALRREYAQRAARHRFAQAVGGRVLEAHDEARCGRIVAGIDRELRDPIRVVALDAHVGLVEETNLLRLARVQIRAPRNAVELVVAELLALGEPRYQDRRDHVERSAGAWLRAEIFVGPNADGASLRPGVAAAGANGAYADDLIGAVDHITS